MTPTLSHHEEGRLFRTDYFGWCAYVAPRWIAALLCDAESVNKHWPHASDTLRAAIWRIADDDTKARIRKCRAAAAAHPQPSLL